MTGLRENIGKRVLKKKLKSFKREVQVHNFNTAGSAVILFDGSEAKSFQVIKDFRKFLEDKGIQCAAFGYIDEKEIPEEMLLWGNYSFITRKDLNWYRKPMGESAEAFFNQDHDMLVDFTRDVPLELQFLVRLSAARFKIGSYTEKENDYDLMINIKDNQNTAYLAEQIIHYVSMLNPTN